MLSVDTGLLTPATTGHRAADALETLFVGIKDLEFVICGPPAPPRINI